MCELMLDDVRMENQRAQIYAARAVKLDEDHAAADAADNFDTALTNALVVIVAHEWSGQEKGGSGWMRSARDLLKLIKEKAEAGCKARPAPGEPDVCLIPDPHPVTDDEPPACVSEGHPHFRLERTPLPPLDTRIDIATLADALDATQPTRHGREGGRPLERRHIDALLALDDHTSLMVLDAEREDRYERSASEEDRREWARALRRLGRVGKEEADRRAAEAAELHEGYHPKHNPDGLDLQDCPVCNYTAFSSEGGDELGMQIGVGQCLVCHYERSSAIAAQEARESLYETRWTGG
ncbi:hypothetical protein [Streptomyces sp. NPDC056669]|uniref:hypothetical protein n=1 Tax=Streptomyces sp. NPDC056669 TaxID=3345903 RepID=UPI0036B341DF